MKCSLLKSLEFDLFHLVVKERVPLLNTELCDKLEPFNPDKSGLTDLAGVSLERLSSMFLLRKEVIQPQVPLRLPCYDFIPITIHTFGICFLAVGAMTSGTNGFHDVTGGVYKARERIHRDLADSRLLATPTSWSRVADSNPN